MPTTDALAKAMEAAPVGSLLIIDPNVGPPRPKAIKTSQGPWGSWVDLESVHHFTRTTADLLQRLADFTDRLRVLPIDLTNPETEETDR